MQDQIFPSLTTPELDRALQGACLLDWGQGDFAAAEVLLRGGVAEDPHQVVYRALLDGMCGRSLGLLERHDALHDRLTDPLLSAIACNSALASLDRMTDPLDGFRFVYDAYPGPPERYRDLVVQWQKRAREARSAVRADTARVLLDVLRSGGKLSTERQNARLGVGSGLIEDLKHWAETLRARPATDRERAPRFAEALEFHAAVLDAQILGIQPKATANSESQYAFETLVAHCPIQGALPRAWCVMQWGEALLAQGHLGFSTSFGFCLAQHITPTTAGAHPRTFDTAQAPLSRCRGLFAEAFELYRSANALRGMSQASSALGHVALLLGELSEGLNHYRAAVEYAERSGDLRAWRLSVAGVLRAMVKMREERARIAELASQLTQRLLKTSVPHEHVALALSIAYAGRQAHLVDFDLEAALGFAETAEQVDKELNLSRPRLLALGDLVEYANRAGMYDVALNAGLQQRELCLRDPVLGPQIALQLPNLAFLHGHREWLDQTTQWLRDAAPLGMDDASPMAFAASLEFEAARTGGVQRAGLMRSILLTREAREEGNSQWFHTVLERLLNGTEDLLLASRILVLLDRTQEAQSALKAYLEQPAIRSRARALDIDTPGLDVERFRQQASTEEREWVEVAADAALFAGLPKEAQRLLASVGYPLSAAPLDLQRLKVQFQYALASHQLGEPFGLPIMVECLAVCDELRQRLTRDDTRRALSKSISSMLCEATCAFGDANPSLAFETADVMQSRTLTELIGGTRLVEQSSEAATTLVRSYHAAAAEVDRWMQLELQQRGKASDARRERERARAQLVECERRLAQALPKWRDMVIPVSDRLDVDKTVASLGPAQALFSFFKREHEYFRFDVTSKGVSGPTRCPLDWPERKLLHSWTQSIRNGAEPPDSLPLTRALFHGALELLESAKHLYIVPVDKLNGLPFAALQLPPTPAIATGRLGLSKSITILPSARLLTLSNETTLALGRPLVLGDPSLTAAPPLPCARLEAIATARRYSVVPQVGADANITNLVAGLSRKPRLIHLAAHGTFVPDAVLDSGIELSDGRLTTAQLMGFNLGGATVIIGACEAAAGRNDGTELLGIVRSFQIAGASVVVAPLWPVDDLSTFVFMDHLHAALQQVPPAEALKKAASTTATLTLLQLLEWAEQMLRCTNDGGLIGSLLAGIATWCAAGGDYRQAASLLERAARAFELANDFPSSEKCTQRSFRYLEAPNRSNDAYCPFADPFHWSGFVAVGVGRPISTGEQ